jgi:hypothetical protein
MRRFNQLLHRTGSPPFDHRLGHCTVKKEKNQSCVTQVQYSACSDGLRNTMKADGLTDLLHCLHYAVIMLRGSESTLAACRLKSCSILIKFDLPTKPVKSCWNVCGQNTWKVHTGKTDVCPISVPFRIIESKDILVEVGRNCVCVVPRPLTGPLSVRQEVH